MYKILYNSMYKCFKSLEKGQEWNTAKCSQQRPLGRHKRRDGGWVFFFLISLLYFLIHQFFYFIFFIYFIYFWLCWVFAAARGLSLVAASGGYSSLQRTKPSHCGGFSCCGAWALAAQASVVVTRGLSSCGSWALEHRLSSCGAWA